MVTASARTIATLGLVWFLVSPTELISQGSDVLATGARVRVVAAEFFTGSRVARVVGGRADSLLLGVTDRASPLALPVHSITRLELSHGKKSKVVTGAGVGLLVGMAATAAFLAMFCADPDTLCESDEVFRAFVIIAPPPTALGALVGLVVRVERWKSLPIERLGTGAAGTRGLAAGFVYRF